jgi:hypothetical protein
LLFGDDVGIKRRARLISSGNQFFTVLLTSSRVEQNLSSVVFVPATNHGLYLSHVVVCVEVITSNDNEPPFSTDSVVSSILRCIYAPLHLLLTFVFQPMSYPFRHVSGFSSWFSPPELSKGSSGFPEGFFQVSPDCHVAFGIVSYNVMKMKPVTRLAKLYILLTPGVAYGLLSQVCPAIVVNCFTFSTKIEVRNV